MFSGLLNAGKAAGGFGGGGGIGGGKPQFGVGQFTGMPTMPQQGGGAGKYPWIGQQTP